jgi:hypothetical protein
VRDRRAKRRRVCLQCDRVFVTTAASRLCGSCTTRAQQLSGGVDEAAVPIAERGRVRRLPAS